MNRLVYSALLLSVISLALGTRITLDDDAIELCKKYKMMCKTGKVCAVQHFDWPKNISIPVCIPLSFVPLRNAYCQLPADPGRCHARYIRWFFKSEAGECTHFQFGGCDGNQNNFMSKRECETTCMATPTIRLFDDNQPVVIAQPVSYDTQRDPKLSYEALNSVKEEPKPAHTFERYQAGRQRNNQVRDDEANTRTRRRLDKEKDKERKRKERERKREKKRLRKMMKQELRRKLRLEEMQREIEKRKKKNVMLEQPVEDKKEIANKKNTKNTADLAKETKDMITGKIQSQTDKEKRREERRKERRLQKRREKQRQRRERERQRLLAEDTEDLEEPFRDLVTVTDKSPQVGSKVGQGKGTTNPKGSVARSS